ncbi:hypothetical protein O6P43_032751 [Quillaja saponaria]|uniref:Uncharacterized protein n=1 Tax=Quillaja saponaria TaxID=32244 RepID=A0AAD7KQN9_QUISA|nr:hypothetical protein O6P43_032751 [Quillaja saponaria]
MVSEHPSWPVDAKVETSVLECRFTSLESRCDNIDARIAGFDAKLVKLNATLQELKVSNVNLQQNMEMKLQVMFEKTLKALDSAPAKLTTAEKISLNPPNFTPLHQAQTHVTRSTGNMEIGKHSPTSNKDYQLMDRVTQINFNSVIPFGKWPILQETIDGPKDDHHQTKKWKWVEVEILVG